MCPMCPGQYTKAGGTVNLGLSPEGWAKINAAENNKIKVVHEAKSAENRGKTYTKCVVII